MKKRNTGLDLCRILSMLGIVILHIIGNGGAQQAIDGAYTPQYWVTEWFLICALCSVDVFAIMSGYLGINKKTPTIYRTIELISIVTFFCLIITACFVVIFPERFMGIRTIINGVIPALAGRYWYITNFIPILLFQPFLNKMILSLTEKQHLVLCVMSFLVFSIAPSVLMKDFFKFAGGYSFAWLLCLYIIGAYLKRSRVDTYKIPKKYLLLAFVVLSVALLLGNVFLTIMTGSDYKYLITYDSPVILLMSIAFFLLLKSSNISKGTKMLKLLSMVAFDIYIIHSHIFIFDNMIEDSFTKISTLPVYLVIPVIILIAMAIYIVCTVISFIRIKLFEITGFNKLMLKCSAKIDNIIYSDSSTNN